MTPRRLCPACSRRYAQLVDDECLVCKGLGVLTLGAAALHHYDPAPIARAIEVFLESKARATRAELPLGQHRHALEVAVDDLRLAGVLSDGTGTGPPSRTPPPRDASSARIAELDSYRVARALGTPASTAVIASLAAPPVDDLAQVRPRNGHPPTGSANGHRTALATIADPIDPLGPDTATIAATRYADKHRAGVIAAAVPTAATRRSNRA